MRELPTGTVTFLFTDIEGSTRLLHELGTRYADVLAEHGRVLRDAFSRRGGIEVDTQGDAFFVAFARASDALLAAKEAQTRLADVALRVRMGIHTGEPLVTEEGYVGIDVHRAARIAAAGHGGQILVSQSTRDLVDGAGLRDLGEHRLKDLMRAERIYQAGELEFPPLKSLNYTNLPVAANPLIGRERELSELTAMLHDSQRLLTLTGPGGTGKTRLALQVGAELVERFSGGVFFVPLADLAQSDLVVPAIVQTVGVRDVSELAQRDVLLVVDNFEHLLEAASGIADLLGSAASARLLVTSRAPLRLDGEREYPIDPLPDAAAVELLVERARAVRPDFRPDEFVVEICRRLDGLPLALELAASRLRSLGSQALLGRLERRLPLLTGGRRDAPDRQRTLRATIEWSYDLLDGELQEVFRHLAVFAGTFSLEAAEAAAGAGLDQLDALVEASLIKALAADRFLMLETIREFALECLEQSGEEEALRLRHAEFFIGLADSLGLCLESIKPEIGQRHDLALLEANNMRGAISWALETGRTELGLALAVRLENFWVTQNPAEGRRWFSALLDQAHDLAPELRARGLRCHGSSTYILGEFDRGAALYRQSLDEYRGLGDDRGIATMLHRLAADALRTGDLERARSLAEESLVLDRRVRSATGEAQVLSLLAELDWREGAHERALEMFEQSIELSRKAGFRWGEAGTVHSLGEHALELGRFAEAQEAARRALTLARDMHDRQMTVYSLGLVARVAAQTGRLELAGSVWGAIEAEEARGHVGQWEDERDSYAAEVLSQAGPELERARREGSELTLADAVEFALAETDDAGSVD